VALYTNNTRFTAIVTIKLSVIQDAQAALSVGLKSTMRPVKLATGVHDIVVHPGEEIDLSDGTVAEFIASRGT
jgi:hypothetical protein